MTCPLDAWHRYFSLDEAAIIDDDARLDLVCCTREVRKLTSSGIRYGNCDFNNDALKGLLYKYKNGASFKVNIRTDGYASRIWVKDPGLNEHIEVLNQDPVTRDLTFSQVSILVKLQHAESLPGRLIARTEARRRMEEIVKRAQATGNAKGFARLIRLLGIDILDGREPAAKKAVRGPTSQHEASAQSSSKELATTIQKNSTDTKGEINPNRHRTQTSESLPIFNVIKRSS